MKKSIKSLVSMLLITSVIGVAGGNVSVAYGQDKANSNASKVSNTSNAGSFKIDLNDKEIFKHIIKEDDKSITIKDARDKEVTIAKNPKKVICTYNSFLDLWYKCGGSVIGKVEDSKDKIVKGAENATVVGKPAAPSLEMITSLSPDLVILSNSFKAHVELAKQLEDQGTSILVMNPVYLNDYIELVRIYTAINNKPELFKMMAEDVLGQINDIKAKAPKDKNYTAAIMLATAKNLTLKTSSTTVGEIIKDLNVENIADKVADGKESIIFSMEKLIEEDPEFIFVVTMGSDKEAVMDKIKADAESNEAWSTLKAIKNNNYVVLPKDLFTYDPNDRYAEAYLDVAKVLYKDVFK